MARLISRIPKRGVGEPAGARSPERPSHDLRPGPANARERFLGRFDNGITFETPDRRSSFTLGGRVHLDYRQFSQDTAASTFDMRRAYLTLQGKWNEYLTWDVTGNFAQTTATQLDVAWMNIAYSDAVQARFGQFKMPFSIEELSSSRFRDFQERSLVNGLVPQKERGAMIHGVPMPGITYGVALSTGQGKNNNDLVAPRSNPDIVGRVTANFAELFDLQANNVMHLGVAATDGDLPTGFGLSQRTESRGLTFFNTAGFTGQDVHRTRVGVETVLARGPVKFQSEFVQASYKGRSSAGTNFYREIHAYYAEVLWMITGERYAESYRNGVERPHRPDLELHARQHRPMGRMGDRSPGVALRRVGLHGDQPGRHRGAARLGPYGQRAVRFDALERGECAHGRAQVVLEPEPEVLPQLHPHALRVSRDREPELRWRDKHHDGRRVGHHLPGCTGLLSRRQSTRRARPMVGPFCLSREYGAWSDGRGAPEHRARSAPDAPPPRPPTAHPTPRDAPSGDGYGFRGFCSIESEGFFCAAPRWPS